MIFLAIGWSSNRVENFKNELGSAHLRPREPGKHADGEDPRLEIGIKGGIECVVLPSSGKRD